jgi:uroporphyrinogen decarboxylase
MELPTFGDDFQLHERMIPEFEERVIERRERTVVVQDWKGNICEISDQYETRHLKDGIDFVTRRWIKCPVECRADWESMKKRYDATAPERLPEDARVRAAKLETRDYPIGFQFSGPFWQLREWMGFENLCVAFYDDPSLVQEMVEFWTDHVATLIRRGLRYVTPDWFHISEDMAYKAHAMISPDMCRKYLLPCWRAWGDIVRGAGVPLYGVDSDGFIGELIPIWIEAGVNFCDPVEVAAHNDICELRKQFGREMAYTGGIDKRAIAAGGSLLEDEVNRVTPVIEDGGYIPGCDHGVPSDISWENFVSYCGLIASRTGWL